MVISVLIKYLIHNYPRALFNDIGRVSAYFYDIPGRDTLNDIPGSRTSNSTQNMPLLCSAASKIW